MELLAFDGEKIAEAAAYVIVEAVNNAPSVASPTWTVIVEEDAGPTHIPAVYMTDPDAHETPRATVEVKITTVHAIVDNRKQMRTPAAALHGVVALSHRPALSFSLDEVSDDFN